MLSLKLCNDRTEVDMDRLADGFSITRTELEACLRLATISYWYELGASDDDTPEMVFRAIGTGRRVALDRVGNIVTRSDEAPGRAASRPGGTMDTSADPRPDEASAESLPASRSIALGPEPDRLVA